MPIRSLIPKVALLYAVLGAVIFSFGWQPGGLIAHPDSEIYIHIWEHNWVMKMLNGESGFLHADMINFPKGGLLFPVDFFNSLLFVLLRLFFSISWSHNIILLAQLTGGATAMFALARELTRDPLVSFISGSIYAFSPYMLAYPVSSGINEALNIAWIPLMILYLLKMITRPCARNAFLAGFFCSINYATCPYHGQMSLVFLFFFFIYALLVRNAQPAFSYNNEAKSQSTSRLLILKQFSFFICFTTLFLLPFYFLLTYTIRSSDSLLPHTVFTDRTSNQFLQEFRPSVPSRYTAFLIDYIRPGKANSIQVSEVTTMFRCVYSGISVLALSLLGIISTIRKSFTRFSLVTCVCFIGLSVGPFFPLSGTQYLSHPWSPLYLFFYHFFPFFDYFLEPFRFVLLVSLFLALFATMGVRTILQWMRLTRRKQLLVIGGLTMIILIDYLLLAPIPYPLPRTILSCPKVYKDLGHDTDTKAILELPFTKGGSLLQPRERFYYQMVHGKAITDTIHGFHNAMIEENSLLKTLFEFEQNKRVNHQPESDKEAVLELKKQGIGAIVVASRMYNQEVFERVSLLLDTLCSDPKRYDDGFLLYQLP